MKSFIKQFENKKHNDYEYDLFKSVGDVSYVHSEQYFIGRFGAIPGWSGVNGIIGDNLEMIEKSLNAMTYHCILIRGSLDVNKYRGNWCMLVTHKVYAATYYKLVNAKSEFFDITKLDRKYRKYTKKVHKNGYYLDKFKLRERTQLETPDNSKIEI